MVNNRQLAQIGLGLIGVSTFVAALAGAVQIVGFALAGPGSLAAVLVLSELVLVGASYVLVFQNDRVMQAIFPGVDDAGNPLPPDFATTLIVVAGVFFLVPGVAGAVANLLAVILAGRSDGGHANAISLVSSVIRAGIGLYLVRRPTRVLGYLRRPAPAPAA